MKVHLDQFDDASKKKLLNAVAERGKASGLEAAAAILIEMADAHTRFVGTNTIKDVARAFSDKAANLREQADDAIKRLQQI